VFTSSFMDWTVYLRSKGVPDILLDLIVALHENTGAQVRCGKNLSGRFQTTSGVRQGCILAPALFSVAIDWIMDHMSHKPVGRFPDRSWRRRPGRPSNRWLDQLRGDNNSSPADLWRRASSRGHSGLTLRSSPTTR